MNPLVKYGVTEGIAVITIDNPPVNALSPGVPEGLEACVARANDDASVKAVVVIGAGRTFIAGADIKELEASAWGQPAKLPALHNLLARIEDSAKPVVMALHGTTLGGGLEVAMAGHYRIAARDGVLGQPEVNLGIIPGAEGTQRLPRLVGVEKAIDMCVTGKPITAADALAVGLVDAVTDGNLLEAAIAFARRQTAPVRTRDRNEKLGTAATNAPLYAAGRVLAAKVRRGSIAPLKVVEAIEAAVALPFDEGCRRERELFAECVASDQARALIHAFFAERGVSKIPGVTKDTAVRPVAKVAIVGAGTMGGGIAMACANAGLQVLLRDTQQSALDRGIATIRKNYDVSVKRGRFTAEGVEDRMARIHPQLDYAGFESANIIIEAAFEDMAIKKQIFAEIDAIAAADCILGTNTSTLDIDEIASATKRPQSVVGLHFFSPANVMRLVEIVRGKATSDEVLATALAFAKKLNKVGVVAGNCPGFIGNRMMFPYMYEAQFLVEEGATPEQVDQALTDFGMAMGIFAVDDMAGIDVAWRVRKALGHFTEPGVRKPLVQDQLFEMGRYGQKTGRGWYIYDANRKATPDPEVLTLIRKSAIEAGIPQRTFTAQEIIERTIYALINEGARILEEGYALRAADIDVIYINGYGFPARLGGPMMYADQTGLAKIVARISQPAPLLVRLAKENKTFREYDIERA
jgi:3-hydroxyacyl-CoA dehydrogenase